MVFKKNCISCGVAFETEYTWAVNCKSCYVSNKKKEKKEKDNLLQQIDYWKQRAIEAESMAYSIDQEMIRKMIGLCHPDKHSNSDTSNTVTKYLLGIRKK